MLRVLRSIPGRVHNAPQQNSVDHSAMVRVNSSAPAMELLTYSSPSTSLRTLRPFSNKLLSLMTDPSHVRVLVFPRAASAIHVHQTRYVGKRVQPPDLCNDGVRLPCG